MVKAVEFNVWPRLPSQVSVSIPECPSKDPLLFKGAAETDCPELQMSIDRIRTLVIRAKCTEDKSSPKNDEHLLLIPVEIPPNLEVGQKYRLVVSSSGDFRFTGRLAKDSEIEQAAKMTPISSSEPVDENGNTPLHQAIMAKKGKYEGSLCVTLEPFGSLDRNLSKIERLLKEGANPNARNKHGDTPMHLVAQLSYWGGYHRDVVDLLLLYKADPNIPNKAGETPFHQVAAARAYTDTIDAILKAGGKPNIPNQKGDTVLHILAENNRSLSDSFKTETGDLLVKYQANLFARNSNGDTPLHRAVVSERDLKEIEWFLNAGADSNIPNLDGNTPLHYLAGKNQYDMWNHEKIVSLFLEHHADVTMKNNKGQLPVHLAFERKGSTAIDLLTPPSDCTAADEGGVTPLHHAAGNRDKNLDEFQKILAKFPNPMIADKRGQTPLHLAARIGFVKAVEVLLSKTDMVDLPDAQKETPLDYVVSALLYSDYLREITSYSSLQAVGELIEVLNGTRKELTWILFPKDLKAVLQLLLDRKASTAKTIQACYSHAKNHTTFRFSQSQMFGK